MRLDEYKPINPEAEEFLKELSNFMNVGREHVEIISNGHTHRLVYAYHMTLVMPPDFKRYDFHSWGERILYFFHKLWEPDYINQDMIMHCFMEPFKGRVGYDVTFGIGGDLVMYPTDKVFARYKLNANGVNMEIDYGVMDVCLPDGEWIKTNGVSISFSKK